MKNKSLFQFSIDDCLKMIPAAGWRNGTSLNNAGENGNYWSSSPNESNTNNAYNLNFNSSSHNVNWNNRNNGQSVRPVLELTEQLNFKDITCRFSINKTELLQDLYIAYKDARKNKRNKLYQLDFELLLEENLVNLRNELLSAKYKPLPSMCFIIHDPKMREVFAAHFRDRVVHHLFYNYTHILFEKSFIYDCYSCIENRGTHFGIKRLKHHITSVSKSYTGKCYVLKIDMKGYFMSIDRRILLKLCKDLLVKQWNEMARANKTLPDCEFIMYLLDIIVNNNPIENCKIIGRCDDWKNLPPEKSLFYSAEGCGLPIGNLSSQLFSNVYLNKFDQYVKRVLKCKHYGRYVDDAYIVSDDKQYLYSLIPVISNFLQTELSLSVNKEKTKVLNAYYGVEFLGAFIKPHRTYISSRSLKRIKSKVLQCRWDAKNIIASVNSYLGVFFHYNSYCIRKVLFGYKSKLGRIGKFDGCYKRYHYLK